jgi:hypothetical protein
MTTVSFSHKISSRHPANKLSIELLQGQRSAPPRLRAVFHTPSSTTPRSRRVTRHSSTVNNYLLLLLMRCCCCCCWVLKHIFPPHTRVSPRLKLCSQQQLLPLNAAAAAAVC